MLHEKAGNLQNYTEDIDKVIILKNGAVDGDGDSDGKLILTENY